MTDEQKNKVITLFMGDCWHEWEPIEQKPNAVPKVYAPMKCGKCFLRRYRYNSSNDDIDFDTPEGFFRLFNWLKVGSYWPLFYHHIKSKPEFAVMKDYQLAAWLFMPRRFTDELISFLRANIEKLGYEDCHPWYLCSDKNSVQPIARNCKQDKHTCKGKLLADWAYEIQEIDEGKEQAL